MKTSIPETPRGTADDPYCCMDCRGLCDNYYVKEDVWRSAVPNTEEVAIGMANKKRFDAWRRACWDFGPLDVDEQRRMRRKLTRRALLCFNCLERRLNRQLVLEDFADAQVNRPIFLGFALAQAGKGKA